MPRKNANARTRRTTGTLAAVPSTTEPPAARPAEDKLRDALRDHPGATVAELAEAAGIGRSTTSKILTAWGGEGSVTRTPGIATGGRRPADRWTLTDTTTPQATAADDSDAPDSAAEAAQPDTDTSSQDAGPVGQAQTAPADASDEPQPDTIEDPESIVDNGDGAAPPAEAQVVVEAGADTPLPVKAARLGKGALRGMVEDYLRDHAGEHSPNTIGTKLGRSSGAVANALEKLVTDHYAVRVSDHPKRYAIAPQAENNATNPTTPQA